MYVNSANIRIKIDILYMSFLFFLWNIQIFSSEIFLKFTHDKKFRNNILK